MELRHLRYFVAVASELNFTRAAKRLHLSQPALSRQISQLEEELGRPLFGRTKRSVTLTEVGATFLTEAKALILQSENVVRAVRLAAPAEAAELRIGYVWGLFHTMAPAALLNFRSTHPHIATHLLDLSATEQARALRKGEIDVGFIGFRDEAEASKLSTRKVGQCDWVLAVPARHKLGRRAGVRLQAFKNDFFISISTETYPAAFRLAQEACRRSGFAPKTLQSAERAHAALGLVAAGCGVALLPDSLAALPHPGVILRSMPEIEPAGLYVAWSDAHRSPAREKFLGSLPVSANATLENEKALT